MRHMKKNLIALIAVILLVAVVTATSAPRSPQQAASTSPSTAGTAQLATIKDYCSGCHNDKAKTGGVSFEGITAASIAQQPELFEKAVRKLRGRVMPPPTAKQPESKAVDSLVSWLETSLDKAETKAHITDQVVLHR